MEGSDWLAALVRHGKAERESNTGRDADRCLTGRGLRQAEWLGRELTALGLSGVPIVSSPAVRTRQTAELIAEITGSEIELADCLSTEGTVSGLITLLADRAPSRGLIVVGHNPTVSAATALLAPSPTVRGFEMRTGEAAVCSFPGQAGPGLARLNTTVRMPQED
jgi:phosphohistidine phosphatase